jgi:hypothetical protein
VSVVFGPDGMFAHDAELTLQDPRKLMNMPNQPPQNKRYKLYVAHFEAGQRYRIDMISTKEAERLDAFLILRDDKGNELARDDDSGGFPHAQIHFVPAQSGIFHIEATYFINPGDIEPTGSYRLVVWHVN